MAEGIGVAGKVISAFVLLIIGIILLGSVSTSTGNVTNTFRNANQTADEINVTSARGGVAEANDDAWDNATWFNVSAKTATSGTTVNEFCPITNFNLRNYSNVTWTAGVDYQLNASQGTFRILNTSTTYGMSNATGNLTFAEYTACPQGYLEQSWARATLNTAPGLFAIALMLIAVGLFFSAYMDVRRM